MKRSIVILMFIAIVSLIYGDELELKGSKEKNGLILMLLPSNGEFIISEQVILDALIVNVSNKVVNIPEYFNSTHYSKKEYLPPKDEDESEPADKDLLQLPKSYSATIRAPQSNRYGCGAGIRSVKNIVQFKKGNTFKLKVRFKPIKKAGLYILSVTKISSSWKKKKFPQLWTGILKSNEVLVKVVNN